MSDVKAMSLPLPTTEESSPYVTTIDGRKVRKDQREAAFEFYKYAAVYIGLNNRADAAGTKVARLLNQPTTDPRVLPAYTMMLSAKRNAGIALQITGTFYNHFGIPITSRPEGYPALAGIQNANGEWVEQWVRPNDWIRAGERLVSEVDAVLPPAQVTLDATVPQTQGVWPLLGAVITWFIGLPWAAQVILVALGITATSAVTLAVIRYSLDFVSSLWNRDVAVAEASIAAYERMADKCLEINDHEAQARCFEGITERIDVLNRRAAGTARFSTATVVGGAVAAIVLLSIVRGRREAAQAASV